MTQRADMLAIRTAMPAEQSFSRMVERVGLQLFAGGAADPFAQATMPWSHWKLLMRCMGDVQAACSIGKMIVTVLLPSSEAAMTDGGGQRTSGVRLGYTDAGHVMIELLDDAGGIVAYAELTTDQFNTFIGWGDDILDVVAAGGLATVKCAGAA